MVTATYMVGAPPGTPREITAILEEAFRSIIEDNENFAAWAEEAGVDIAFRGYDDTRAMLSDVLAVLEEMDIKSIIEELEKQ